MDDHPFAFAYAYATGPVLIEGMEEYYDPTHTAEYKAAIDEYFRLEGEGEEH